MFGVMEVSGVGVSCPKPTAEIFRAGSLRGTPRAWGLGGWLLLGSVSFWQGRPVAFLEVMTVIIHLSLHVSWHLGM